MRSTNKVIAQRVIYQSVRAMLVHKRRIAGVLEFLDDQNLRNGDISDQQRVPVSQAVGGVVMLSHEGARDTLVAYNALLCWLAEAVENTE